MATKVKLIADGVITPDQITLTTASSGTNTTAPATTAFVQQEISALVDSSPDALNTLNELAAALGDNENFATDVNASIAAKLPLAGGTMTGNLNFGDSDKAIFGAGSDLQIYHDPNHSIINESGTGSLKIQGDNIRLQKTDGTENMLTAVNDGAVTIFYDSSPKLATTSSGVDVTGTATMDGLTVDTSTLVVDSTNNRVGIGTDSPSAKLELNVPTGDGLLINSADIATIKMKYTGGAVKNWGFATTNLAASDFGIYQSNSNGGDPITAGTARMYFDGSGNVLVGKTATGGNTAGMQIIAGSFFSHVRDDGVVQVLNRKTSDGDILKFEKDNSTVGNINSLSGRMAIGSNDTGIFFDSTRNCISPFDMSINDGRNAAIDIGRTGVRFNNAFLEKVTIEGTSNDEGIYLSTNHRIYGGGYRAFEASTSAGGSVSLGEGYTTGEVLISAPELQYPEDLRFKDDNGILRFTKTVGVGESATTVLTITKSSYSYFIGGTITFILVDSGSPWGVRTQTYSISGRVATYQAGDNMGVSYSLIKETDNMDYTPTLTTVDTRTSGQNGGTYEFKFANGSGQGSSSCKVIFDGYFAGGALS